MLDESALTGESQLVERAAGEPVRSGVVNAGRPFELRATVTARAAAPTPGSSGWSQAGPRSARRWSGWPTGTRRAFLPLTLLLAGAGLVRSSGTPCGRWRCWWWPRRARCCWPRRSPSCPGCRGRPARGVVVRGGGALETLGRARTMLFDKTGTLTAGRPRGGRRGRRAGGDRPTRCCGWRPRWISSRRTCWPRRVVAAGARARAGAGRCRTR